MASRSSSQRAAGVASGSWSRSRWASAAPRRAWSETWSPRLLKARGSGGCPLPEEDVGEPVRGEPLRAAFHDLLGEPAQVLQQCQAEGDGHRPQLADQERLHALEGQDEALEHEGSKRLSGMGDQRPGEPDHARRALEAAPRSSRGSWR